MNVSIKAVLFDLDGTLIHSAPDLQRAANAVGRTRDWQEFDLPTIISFIGNGVPTLVSRLFEARGVTATSAEIDNAVAQYLAYYQDHSTDLTKPYEGVVETLDWLKQKGVGMAIVTNKPAKPARKIIQDLQLDHYFSAVVGGDTVAVKKPHAEPYLAACRALDLSPSETLYIGDSETDSNTAAAVPVPFILFTDGYRNSPIDEIIHWQTIDKFKELRGVLEDVLG